MSKTQKNAAGIERVGLGLLLATTALSAAGTAAAQQAPGTVGEIIVTAQKRSENLQDVPVSIQAFGTQQLEDLHITDFDDYALMLPSVSFRSSGPGFSAVYFRGVSSGENSNHSASLPTVGTYLDEQPITTITGNLDIHLYDIQRVEALAGPQGTLYGASSEAGTIRIITNAPDPSGFSASYNAEINSIDNGGIGEVVEGHVNIPINDRAAIRLVAWQEHAGGYIDNVPGSVTFPTSGIVMDNSSRVDDDYNTVDTYGARAALRVELNDNWTVTPTLMGQSQESNGIFAFDTRAGDLQVSHFFPEFAEDTWVQAALTVEGRIANLDVVYAGSYLTRNVDGAADYTDYAYFYDALYSYGSSFYDNAYDLINPAQYINFYDRYRKQSHEFRISTPAENRLRFVGGVFYQRQYHQIHQRYIVNGDWFDGFEVHGLTDTIWLTEQTRIDRDWAVFGELSLDLTDRLTATAGMRAYRYRNSLAGFFGFEYNDPANGYVGFSGNPVYLCTSFVPFRDALCTNLNKEVEDEGTTYRVNLNYDVNDDIMIYGTVSTGFRPGGINRRGNLPPYDADTLTNYEFGWKTELADNRVRFNGAVFFEQWKDFQYSLLGANGLTQILNAADAEITGVEASLDWLVTDNFTLQGGATLLHAETTSDLCNIDRITSLVDCTGGLEAPSGTELPVTPEFKANLTGRYNFQLNNWDAFVQTSLVYQSEVFNDIRVASDNERRLIGNSDAYALADFTAGFDMPTWSLSFYVNNLTDERAEINRYAECATQVCATDNAAEAPGGPGIYVVPVQPRTIGIRFGQRF